MWDGCGHIDLGLDDAALTEPVLFIAGMDSALLVSALGFLFLGFVTGRDPRTCGFPAIYNFGDSNSDTGAISASIGEVPLPNGEHFFGEPAGRHSDGRLIIDFIAENLTLPYVTPYLDSVGANFRHGANFATGGACIRPIGFSPFHLGTQVVQFRQFKARTIALHNQPKGKVPPCKSTLARPKDFSKALYTIDIGQNDLSIGFQNATEEQVQATIPDILRNFTNAVQILYKEGARFFWIHNTGPIGCLPYILQTYPSRPRDKYGCIRAMNSVAKEFNRQLKSKIVSFRTQLADSVFNYVDVYSAKYKLTTDSKSLGFKDPFDYCCGTFFGHQVGCGKTILQNGTEFSSIACRDPTAYISWDGIHYSEAANMWVAGQILDGSLSDVHVPISRACRR